MKKYFLFAAALFALASCNNDEEITGNEPQEIRLSSSIAVQTRATHNLDEALKADEQVHVWVDDAGSGVTNPELYANNIFKAGARGALSGDTPMFFPSTGNNVNIYAIHGNFGSTDLDNFWGTPITHSVAQDQQSSVTDAGKGYAVSDLVYCKKADVARQKSVVNLEFEHLLSKVEVVLVQGNGAPGIKSVEIINTKLNAQFTPDKASAWSVSAAGTITDGNPITIDNGLTNETDAKGTDETKKVLNEAIIVPQTLTNGTQFIRVTTDKDGVLVYALDKGTEFNAGYKYRYTITANLTGLVVTATITPWSDGGNTPGDATMQ